MYSNSLSSRIECSDWVRSYGSGSRRLGPSEIALRLGHRFSKMLRQLGRYEVPQVSMGIAIPATLGERTAAIAANPVCVDVQSQ